MKFRSLFLAFVLCFGVSAPSFAALVCDTGYYLWLWVPDEPDDGLCKKTSNPNEWYDPTTMTDMYGQTYYPVSPSATGYVPPPPPPPPTGSGAQTPADLVDGIDFSDDGVAMLAVLAMIVSILTIGRAVRLLLGVLRRA